MSYTKHLEWNDYSIEFEYDYEPGEQTLVLHKWTAYEGDEEALIPCSITSQYIEDQINKWLEDEWMYKGTNYLEDYEAAYQERKYADN